MVIKEILIKRWWMFVSCFVIILLGVVYAWVKMDTDLYITYWDGNAVENEMEQIFQKEKNNSPMDQVLHFLQWRERQEIRIANIPSSEAERINQEYVKIQLYQSALYGMLSANNLSLLANEEDTIYFSGIIPADYLNNIQEYGRLEQASMLNSKKILRFVTWEQYNLSLFAGIFLSVSFWGNHYENGTYGYLHSSREGGRYRRHAHGILLVSVVAFSILSWGISMIGSGILFTPCCWDASIRGCDADLIHFSHVLTNMTVMEYSLSFLWIHICNGILLYVISYGFVILWKNVKMAFLGSFGMVLVLYFVGEMLSVRGFRSWFLFGYQAGITQFLASAEKVTGFEMNSYEMGILLMTVIVTGMFLLWCLCEARNPYGIGKRRNR